MDETAPPMQRPKANAFRAQGETPSKRSKTLERLLDAAVMLFATKGVDGTSVLEITKEAGAANGTFYNYFNDKAEIVEVIYQRITDTLVRDIISYLDGIDDPLDQVALGTIWFLDAVSRDPHWGSMLAGMLEKDTPFREISSGAIRKYVARGCARGLFVVDGLPSLIDFNVSLLVGAIRRRMELADDASDLALQAAEIQLRMLGMKVEDAHAIPRRAKQVHGDRPPAS